MFLNYFQQIFFPPLKREYANFRVAITETYPQILWELVIDSFGSAEHSLGTTA
jgi:hypothetical protein